MTVRALHDHISGREQSHGERGSPSKFKRWPESVLPTAPSDRIPPIIRQGPANHTLAPGSTTQLHCHIMGNPIPSIQWEKDGQRILGNDGRISLMENGTFQIINLQVFDLKSPKQINGRDTSCIHYDMFHLHLWNIHSFSVMTFNFSLIHCIFMTASHSTAPSGEFKCILHVSLFAHQTRRRWRRINIFAAVF